ncbi:MAG: hypothetical protein ABIL01_20760 [Pseudomonadota bacterium]
MRAAPMFAKWCALNGAAWCPAAPADVARFVADCASLGIERLWPAVQEISKAHSSLGLADPTLGGVAAAALNEIGGISPPRSWPDDRKKSFALLPYDLQVYVAAHEVLREKALRRAQNEAATARQKLAVLQVQQAARTNQIAAEGAAADDRKGREVDPHAAA